MASKKVAWREAPAASHVALVTSSPESVLLITQSTKTSASTPVPLAHMLGGVKRGSGAITLRSPANVQCRSRVPLSSTLECISVCAR